MSTPVGPWLKLPTPAGLWPHSQGFRSLSFPSKSWALLFSWPIGGGQVRFMGVPTSRLHPSGHLSYPRCRTGSFPFPPPHQDAETPCAAPRDRGHGAATTITLTDWTGTGTGGRGGEWFGVASSALHLPCALFPLLFHQVHLRSPGIITSWRLGTHGLANFRQKCRNDGSSDRGKATTALSNSITGPKVGIVDPVNMRSPGAGRVFMD